eukprot:TRINITY_DN4882_c0_g1_i10.p2 TRINITY_DN4882_c0_g1~~TRINITY_DN4882_c0_g1_i10.p2  ORF type:complete len:322 (+),score=46.64 TRINITY_DN4882_c0_g1_i10:513-1478(+)
MGDYAACTGTKTWWPNRDALPAGCEYSVPPVTSYVESFDSKEACCGGSFAWKMDRCMAGTDPSEAKWGAVDGMCVWGTPLASTETFESKQVCCQEQFSDRIDACKADVHSVTVNFGDVPAGTTATEVAQDMARVEAAVRELVGAGVQVSIIEVCVGSECTTLTTSRAAAALGTEAGKEHVMIRLTTDAEEEALVTVLQEDMATTGSRIHAAVSPSSALAGVPASDVSLQGAGSDAPTGGSNSTPWGALAGGLAGLCGVMGVIALVALRRAHAGTGGTGGDMESFSDSEVPLPYDGRERAVSNAEMQNVSIAYSLTPADRAL